MRILTKSLAAAALFATMASTAVAGSATVSDQRYHGGKYVPVADAAERACPRERLTIYRGNLYCRTPLLAVHAPRHPLCPPDVWGLYRGNLYCFGRR